MIPTFDPALHTISFKGNILDDFGPDSLVTIEPDNDAFTYQPGSTGPGTRSRNRDESHTIRVFLLKTSLSNDVLSAIHEGDKLRGDGGGEFVVKDLQGGTSFVGEAWIQRAPPIEVASTAGVSEWVFRCAKPTVYKVGGQQ